MDLGCGRRRGGFVVLGRGAGGIAGIEADVWVGDLDVESQIAGSPQWNNFNTFFGSDVLVPILKPPFKCLQLPLHCAHTHVIP